MFVCVRAYARLAYASERLRERVQAVVFNGHELHSRSELALSTAGPEIQGPACGSPRFVQSTRHNFSLSGCWTLYTTDSKKMSVVTMTKSRLGTPNTVCFWIVFCVVCDSMVTLNVYCRK